MLAELAGFERRRDVLRERADKLVVTAPIAGTVATFDLDRRLRARPVSRGQVLMEVMDDAGPWRLELSVADTRGGRIDDALARAAGADGPGGPATAGDPATLPVAFTVASDPETSHPATLTRVIERAEPDQELGNVLRAYASLDAPERLPRRRIGTEVTAKIDCGPAPLFTVLFGDVVEFVQRNVWL